MTGRDIFKIWAPIGMRWVNWVRPVPFTSMNLSYHLNQAVNFVIPNIPYITEAKKNTAIVIDLPSHDSIQEGISLARLGIRPIPLYNGTNEQDRVKALVDNHSIENALFWGALELKKTAIAHDAPPAFLLDSNRMHRFKMNPSIFDNSWDLYSHDIPSAEYFLSHGINQIIIRSETIQKDLTRIFYPFQKKGIAVFFTNGYDQPKATILKKFPQNKKSL